MSMYKGKALYQPTGKAAEYSPWAVNFYTGCSNDCEYCYCKRGVLSHVWDNKPHLKKCFINERDALQTFIQEFENNHELIGDSGILFSFTTDPLLPETRDLTFQAMEEVMTFGIPVKVLTKRADWLNDFIRRTEIERILYGEFKHLIAFGFTLTGFDEKEPNASMHEDRMWAMKELHNRGYKVFASIEPIITPAMSLNCIRATLEYCDLYKIGLISGKKIDYEKLGLPHFIKEVTKLSYTHHIYIKDSVIDYLGIKRNEMDGRFVESSFNLFKE